MEVRLGDATGTAGAILLGILQGLTEFLPVSSSGHLVLFQQFVDIAGDDVLFDLALHLGTLLPALWFYRADVRGVVSDVVAGEGPWLQRPGVRLALLVVIATLPTAVMGLALRHVFETLFNTPAAVGVAFGVTGTMLWATRGLPEGKRDVMTTPWMLAFYVGLAQGFAITPGISRSGSTIAMALLLGLRRDFAVKFSFLMSVPAILGAVVIKAGEATAGDLDPLQIGLGTLSAMASGYAALVLLVRLVQRGRFADFAWYLWPLSAVTLGLVLLGVA